MALGLLYQWGRKEPFTGQGPSSTVNIATSIYDADGNLIRGAADTDTPAAGALGGFIFNNGAADRTTTLIRNPLTHYCGADNGLITDNPNTWTEPPTLKSIYDPCPYGYRVPPSDSFSGFPTSCPTWTDGDITGGWTTNNTWLPAAGLRVCSTAILAVAGSRTYSFSSSPVGIPAAAQVFLLSEWGGAVGIPWAGKAYDLPGRCIPE